MSNLTEVTILPNMKSWQPCRVGVGRFGHINGKNTKVVAASAGRSRKIELVGVTVADRQSAIADISVYIANSEQLRDKESLTEAVMSGGKLNIGFEGETQRPESPVSIEALRQANCHLRNHRDALHEINETNTIMVGMVAHDLRNPLAAVLSRSEFVQTLLSDKGASPESLAKAIESCDAIISLVQRMDRLIGSVLSQAQAAAPVLRLNVRKFKVIHAIDVAIDINAQAAKRKFISIHTDISGAIVAAGDEDWIVDALDNLIRNAIKYSHSGQSITVGARLSSGLIDIFVRDEGQGLTKQDCQRAFRPYQRLSAKPTAGESSTGLGLAIVKAIAEACGGTIRVDSLGRNKGATFTLSIPNLST